MKKITKMFSLLICMSICISMMPITSHAAFNEVFLCMRNEQSYAYQSSNQSPLDYLEMMSSNGQVATAKVIDGSTYLPFRYVMELVGLTEDNGRTMQNNTFKYESGVGKATITIKTKNKARELVIGEEFEFKVSDDDIRMCKVENLGGSLYFPMRYLASLVDALVYYQASTGNIYFMSNNKVKSDFVTGPDDDLSIKYSKLATLGYYEFDNDLGYSDIYLCSDGSTVSSVTEEMDNNNTYYSVTRSRTNLYYVDEGYEVWRKKETENTSEKIVFYNKKGERTNLLAQTLVLHNNKLYGIALDSVNSKTGKIFKSDLDGENLEFISSTDGYNLLLREDGGKGYIFYVSGTNRKEIHRIDLSNNQDVIVNFVSSNASVVDSNISIMSLSKNNLVICTLDNKIKIINLYDNPYSKTTVSAWLANEITRINGATAIESIASINLDSDNDILYFINHTSKGYGFCCYDLINGKLQSISSDSKSKKRISIIKMSNDLYRIYYYNEANSNKYTYVLMSVKSNEISIDNSIKFER